MKHFSQNESSAQQRRKSPWLLKWIFLNGNTERLTLATTTDPSCPLKLYHHPVCKSTSWVIKRSFSQQFSLASFRHLESSCSSSGKAVICHVSYSGSLTIIQLLEPSHCPDLRLFPGCSSNPIPRCSQEMPESLFTYPSWGSAVVGNAEWKKALIW